VSEYQYYEFVAVDKPLTPVQQGQLRAVLDWIAKAKAAGTDVQLIGTGEHAEFDVDLTSATAVLVGNETVGLSAAWQEAAGQMVRIPIAGEASSLNAATAASIVLYEAGRQRNTVRRRSHR
jgi:TrmH family RNA methyltransferase